MYVAEFFNSYWNDGQPMKKPRLFTKYLGQTLVSMCNTALREKFSFYFSGDCLRTDKIFISGGGLSITQ